MTKYTKQGLAALRQSNQSVKFMLLKQEPVLRACRGALGCAFGFRQNHQLVSREDQANIQGEENRTLLQALIHNGLHPGYQRGGRCASK